MTTKPKGVWVLTDFKAPVQAFTYADQAMDYLPAQRWIRIGLGPHAPWFSDCGGRYSIVHVQLNPKADNDE